MLTPLKRTERAHVRCGAANEEGGLEVGHGKTTGARRRGREDGRDRTVKTQMLLKQSNGMLSN